MKAEAYLIDVLTSTLQKLVYEKPNDLNINIEKPKNKDYGDFSTNIAMLLPKYAIKSPKLIAQEIISNIEYDNQIIEKVEIAGPGFINFTMTKHYYHNQLKTIFDLNENYGQSNIGNSKKVQIEFVSANPTGPLNVVSARAAAVGDILVNLFKTVGYDTQREYYINDAGRQVRLLGESVSARYMELFNKKEIFPEDGYHGAYIKDIAQNIVSKNGDVFVEFSYDERVKKLAQIALTQTIEKNKEIMTNYGVVYDNWFYESDLRTNNEHLKILDFFKEKELSYELDGAIWFKSQQYGDEKDRVLLTSEGEPTYFLIDIAYHKNKFERGFNIVYDLWGPDHHGYIARMKAAMIALGYVKQEFNVEIIQQVNLLRGGKVVKMSKRAGEIIEMQEVIDEVGVDVARYFFIYRKMSSHLDFDIDLAKKQSDENPVYYLQYAHARICSVLKYANEQGFDLSLKADIELLNNKEELKLIKNLLEFPEVIKRCVRLFEPHLLPSYLQSLASSFHHFYHHNRVVSDDKKLTFARLNLVKATKIVLGNGFKILGISAPESM